MKTTTNGEVKISTVGDIELLEGRTWTDVMIKKIATKEVAQLAYEQSTILQNEFKEPGAFVAYWHALKEGRVGVLLSRA